MQTLHLEVLVPEIRIDGCEIDASRTSRLSSLSGRRLPGARWHERTGVSRSSDARKSQFVKRIRTFMSRTLTRPLQQIFGSESRLVDRLQDTQHRRLQGRANTDTRGAMLSATTLKLRSDMRPDSQIMDPDT